MDDDIPYLLLTLGPLATSRSAKDVMLQDHCTQDDDNRIVTDSIAKHLSFPASFTNSSLSGSPRSIRQLKVVPSTTPSIRLSSTSGCSVQDTLVGIWPTII